MVIVNTFYPKSRKQHLITFKSSVGRSLIDYVLIGRHAINQMIFDGRFHIIIQGTSRIFTIFLCLVHLIGTTEFHNIPTINRRYYVIWF